MCKDITKKDSKSCGPKVEVRDPDGHAVEIHQRAAEAALAPTEKRLRVIGRKNPKAERNKSSQIAVIEDSAGIGPVRS